MTLRCLLLLLAVACSGCANLNSIYRSHHVRGGEVIFVDAKQRGVLTNRVQMPSTAKHIRDAEGNITETVYEQGTLARFCSEPSPDVFTVLSASFAGSGSATLSPDSREIAGRIAAQLSEAGSTISRTQTIQTLREMMYRLCERHLNDAIDKETFALQAARDHRIIVSILAIEQLTNATRPGAQQISASASAQVASNVAEIAKEMTKQQEELVKTEAAVADSQQKETTAQEQLQAAESEKQKALDEQTALLKPDRDPEATEEEKEAAKEKLTSTTKDVETKTKALQDQQQQTKVAEKKVETLKMAITQLEKAMRNAETLGVDGTTELGKGSNGCCAVPASVSLQVANAIQEIVRQNIEFDDIGLQCTRIINDASNATAIEFCKSHFEAQKEISLARAQEAQARAAAAQVRTQQEQNRLLRLEAIERQIRDQEIIDDLFGSIPGADEEPSGPPPVSEEEPEDD